MELEIYVIPGPDGNVRVSGPGHLHTASEYDVSVVSDGFRSMPPGAPAELVLSYLGHDVRTDVSRSGVYGNRVTGHLVIPPPSESDFQASSGSPAAKPERTVWASLKIRLPDGSLAANGSVPLVVARAVSDPTYDVDPPSGGTVDPGTSDCGVDSAVVQGSTRPVMGGALYDRFAEVESKIVSPTKESVGLGNVDNTSDADKPMSAAVKEYVDGVKEDVARLQAAVDALAGSDVPGDAGPDHGGESVDSLRDAVASLDVSVVGLTARVEAVETGQTSASADAAAALGKASAVEDGFGGLSDDVASLDASVGGLADRVDELAASVGAASVVHDGHAARLSGLETRVGALERIPSPDTSLSGIQDRMSSVEESVSGLETSVSGLATSVAGSSARLDRHDDNLRSLNVWTSNVGTRLASVENGVSSALGLAASAQTAAEDAARSASEAVASVSEAVESAMESFASEVESAKDAADAAAAAAEAASAAAAEALEAATSGQGSGPRVVTDFETKRFRVATDDGGSVEFDARLLVDGAINVLSMGTDEHLYLVPDGKVDLEILGKVRVVQGSCYFSDGVWNRAVSGSSNGRFYAHGLEVVGKSLMVQPYPDYHDIQVITFKYANSGSSSLNTRMARVRLTRMDEFLSAVFIAELSDTVGSVVLTDAEEVQG